MIKSVLRCCLCGSEKELYGNTNFICGCGGLYDVEHLGLRIDNLADFRLLCDTRAKPRSHSPLYTSGVWRFHKLIMPSLPLDDVVSLGEGILPLWPAGNNLRAWVGGDLDLWFIPEGLGPTGSFKDFGGTVAMSVAKKSGVKAVICASTGDTSAMAAAYAARAGITCAVVLPKGKITDVQLAQPLVHGAKVILIPGNFDECMLVVRTLVESNRAFPINSLNPTRIEGHQASVFLAYQFFNWVMPDVFVVPVGNGSNSASIGKAMRLLQKLGFIDHLAKLIGVQSEAANPLARSWESVQVDGIADPALWNQEYKPLEVVGETTATAALIGNPVSQFKVMRKINASQGAVLTADEPELNEAVMVAGSDGYFVCPQTGTAIAGLRQAVARGLVRKGQQVVIVSTATGLKFPGVPVNYRQNLITETKTCKTEEIAAAIGI